MNLLLTVFFFLLILGFLVFIHEFGHFFFAKVTGVPVKEFAIGFGPIIFSKHFHGTKYRLNLLPLGGFVSLEGEDDMETPEGFRNRSFAVKLAILLGGVTMNLIAAIVFFGIFLLQNNFSNILPAITDYNFTNTKVSEEFYPIVTTIENQGTFLEGVSSIYAVNGERIDSVAEFEDLMLSNSGKTIEVSTFDIDTQKLETANLDVPKNISYSALVTSIADDAFGKKYFEKSDEIIKINGAAFTSQSEFFDALDGSQGQETTFTVVTEEGEVKEVEVGILPTKNENGVILGIGLNFNIEGVNYIPYSQDENKIYFVEYKHNLLSPFAITKDLGGFQIKAIGDLFSNAFATKDFSEVSKVVGSPVAVGSTIGDVVEVRVFGALIFLTALISLSLAMFNVLPIPALDGGQIAIALVESIRGKRISDTTVNRINFAGFVFLMALSVLIIGKDLFQFNIIKDSIDAVRRVFGK